MQIGTTLPKALFGDLGAIRAFALGIEDLGFHYLRLPDRVTSHPGDPTHEPLTLCAYLAGGVRSITFVPAVLIAPSRQTVLLAKQVAELCFVAGGRVRLGLAVGGNRREYAAANVPFSSRGARLEAQIDSLRALWRGEATTGDGQAGTLDRGVTIAPGLAEPPPLWIGTSANPPSVARRRIARLADGWFVPDIDHAAGGFADIRAEADRIERDLSTFGVEGEVSLIDDGARVVGSIQAWRQLPFITHLGLSTWSLETSNPNAHLDRLRVVVDALR